MQSVPRSALALHRAHASVVVQHLGSALVRALPYARYLCVCNASTGPVQVLATNPSSSSRTLKLMHETDNQNLSFRKWNLARRLKAAGDVRTQVDILMEGQPLQGAPAARHSELEALCQRVEEDAHKVVRAAMLMKAQANRRYRLPRTAALSLVLCDDAHMASLNSQYRGKEGPTDVLSFEMGDELDYQVRLPLRLLGDCVISLDTAARQAAERGHSLEAEIRVLLVHGVLHLCGHDHERGDAEHEAMAAAERAIMRQMGWEGEGLISAVHAGGDHVGTGDGESRDQGAGSSGVVGAGRAAGSGGAHGTRTFSSVAVSVGEGIGGRRGEAWTGGALGVLGNIFGSAGEAGAGSRGSVGLGGKPGSNKQPALKGAGGSKAAPSVAAAAPPSHPSSTAPTPLSRVSPMSRAERQALKDRIKLVALDMDGTLLDSSSRIPQAAAQAIHDVIDAHRGRVRVMLATGKARPAAMAAARAAGLEGDHLVVSPATPGVFLQGLAVHGRGGRALSDASLPPSVVADAFRWAEASRARSGSSSGGGVSLVAFLGDECATLRMTDDLQALHHTYYEPLARVEPSLEALLAGPPVRKLLFMTTPQLVEGELKPHWHRALAGSGAEPMQAVPNMLEVVPEGVDKWGGLQQLLRHLGLPPSALMAVGDGGNDLGMVAHAGFGVAMGNAVPSVKAAAKAVVGSNDEGGLVQALRLLL